MNTVKCHLVLKYTQTGLNYIYTNPCFNGHCYYFLNIMSYTCTYPIVNCEVSKLINIIDNFVYTKIDEWTTLICLCHCYLPFLKGTFTLYFTKRFMPTPFQLAILLGFHIPSCVCITFSVINVKYIGIKLTFC